MVPGSGDLLGWIRSSRSIAPPRLLEVCRSRDVSSLPDALDAVVPKAFVTAEAAQATNGGSNPRFPGVFDDPAPETRRKPPGPAPAWW